MLEETLKNINFNLERIANFLENKGNTVKETENSNRNITTIQQAPAPQTAIPQNLIPQTAVPSMPTANTAVIPQINKEPQGIPTTKVQESFTQEQLAVAMSNAVATGKMGIIQGILQQFGVQALTQINPADYNKVATMLKEAGVNI